MNTKQYLRDSGKILCQIKQLARSYHKLTNRPLGVTGEIAEYEAIRLLNLEVCIVRQKGYDALRREGTRKKKIQIKGRVFQEDSKKSQRVGTINPDTEWDSVVLVILDSGFEPIKIYEAKRNKIEIELKRPGSKARNIRGQLSVSKFKQIAKVIWDANNNV